MDVACIRCESKPCICTDYESQMPKSIFEVPMTKSAMIMTAKSGLTTNRCTECTPKDLYITFLQNLFLIYSAMEHELTNLKLSPSFPLEELLFAEKLFRRSAIARDLKHFLGPGWKAKMTSTRATDNYVARIKEVGRTDPDLLLAHHSIRYIGDLQTCDKSRTRARRLFGLSASTPKIGDAELNPGVAFHVFEGIENKRNFEKEYFEKIRGLNLSPEINKKIAKEAKVVYQLNMNLYWELQGLVSKVGEDFQLALDSKHHSLIRFSENVNKGLGTATYLKTDVSATSVNPEERRKIRCRGAPLIFYSLLFWVAVLFLFGALIWGDWICLENLPILLEVKKTLEQFVLAWRIV